MFASSINKVSSYKSLSQIFGSEFSTTTISKMLNETELFLKPKKLRDKTKLLFVNVDDIFVKQHKNKKYPYRMVVAYTGNIGVGNKDRKELVEKNFISINTKKQVLELERTLMLVYGEIGKIVIVGNGASWITSYKNYFSSIIAERYIDQFHYKKYVKDFLGRSIKIDWKYFKTLKTKEIEFYLLSLLTDENREINLSKSQRKGLPKIKKYFKSFVKVSKLKYPNCIEGIQSHFMASMLKTRRSFSKHVAIKIMTINTAQYNNWEITTDKRYGTKLNELGKMEDIITSLTSYESSNLPILDSENSRTVDIFNNIAHGLK